MGVELAFAANVERLCYCSCNTGGHNKTQVEDKPGNTRTYSLQSRIGLNAANFMQAESTGVLLPILSIFLLKAHWRYGQIGIATGIAGLGTLLFQTPAGRLVDTFKRPRWLFAGASVALALCFGLMPILPHTTCVIDTLLFLSGVTQTLFIPLLAALALGLAGHKALNRTLGENQAWNHAGNIAAALMAFFAVSQLGTESIFFSTALVSILGGIVIFMIRREDFHEEPRASPADTPKESWVSLIKQRNVWLLLISVAAFHLSNAPILPMTALYIKKLGGSDGLTTFTVLTAQTVMIPVAWLTGRLCDSWGRKPTLMLAFWVLPFRIASYAFVHSPAAIVVLQALDGVGAGIYSVAIVAFAANLTLGKGQFNTLLGIFATAQAAGGVFGPVLQGFLLGRFGFAPAFLAFAALALLSALIAQLTIASASDPAPVLPETAVTASPKIFS